MISIRFLRRIGNAVRRRLLRFTSCQLLTFKLKISSINSLEERFAKAYLSALRLSEGSAIFINNISLYTWSRSGFKFLFSEPARSEEL